jgi:aminopeptidase
MYFLKSEYMEFNEMLDRYADLLVRYCVSLREGERLLVKSTTLGEPLVRRIHREALKAGGIVEVMLEMEGQVDALLRYGSREALLTPAMQFDRAMREFDAYIHVMAPYSLRSAGGGEEEVSKERVRLRNEGLRGAHEAYYSRTATRALKRTLCQYPTEVDAREAGMTLEAYAEFVFGACRLYDADPLESWLEVRRSQQHIVDRLNRAKEVRYRHPEFDICFGTVGRTWMNSDGQTNMPSGEVYTSPVEDSVNGEVYFSLPALHGGHEVSGVRLWVKDGEIVRWDAKEGKEYLDGVFEVAGTRRFGEAAIGTNGKIRQITRNILFDEKIGGTIHMAIGQSYLQCGGKNESAIHWDMITDMTNGGEIFADGELIYRNGEFLL